MGYLSYVDHRFHDITSTIDMVATCCYKNLLYKFAFIANVMSLVQLNVIASFLFAIYFLIMLKHRKLPVFY